MCLFVVDGNPKKLDILFLEFVVRITERACFLGSARCVVFRVKEQNDPLTLEIGQRNGIAVMVLRFEVRCLVSFFEHKPPLNIRSI